MTHVDPSWVEAGCLNPAHPGFQLADAHSMHCSRSKGSSTSPKSSYLSPHLNPRLCSSLLNYSFDTSEGLRCELWFTRPSGLDCLKAGPTMTAISPIFLNTGFVRAGRATLYRWNTFQGPLLPVDGKGKERQN